MNQLTRIGRIFYSTGLIAFGVQQFIIKDFRSELLSPFPSWAHEFTIFPLLAASLLILAGIMIAGEIDFKFLSAKDVSLYLGFSFLLLIILSHLPYILFFSPHRINRIDVWFGAGEELAYSGGAFVMAGSFMKSTLTQGRDMLFKLMLERFIPAGRVFFSILIILFGSSHFVFTEFVSKMVPGWIGVPLFWTYFVGVALMSSGIAIILKIWLRLAAFLLAFMLFLFVIFFHIQSAMADPYAGGGNEIVRTIVAVLFCGIALVIATTAHRVEKG